MTTDKGRAFCKGTTAKNKPCRTKAMVGSEYCHKHLPEEKAQEIVDKGMTIVDEAIEHASRAPMKQPDESWDPAFAKFELAKRISHSLANSNLVPDAYRGRPNDVFVAVNMGSELGMEPFQAIQSIAVIEGKPCLYGDGLIGVVRASPKCLWIEEKISSDGKTATCRTHRDGDPNPIEASYSMSDAMQAGIDSKFNWKKHPKRMLQMRARAYCLRDAYPDLLKGLGVVEERQDHEDTPPPVTQYTLPKADGGELPVPRPAIDGPEGDARKVFGEGVEVQTITLAEVERAMHQSDSMEQLLAAGDLAKDLPELDQGTARITYKKMRDVLREGSGN